MCWVMLITSLGKNGNEVGFEMEMKLEMNLLWLSHVLGIINGEVDEDLAHLETGPLNHSCWLTFACRILRFYVSQFNPTRNLCLITEFAIKVCFHSWFDIKANKKLTDGSKNLYNMIVRINCLPDKKIKDICYNVLNNNSFLHMVKIFLF